MKWKIWVREMLHTLWLIVLGGALYQAIYRPPLEWPTPIVGVARMQAYAFHMFWPSVILLGAYLLARRYLK